MAGLTDEGKETTINVSQPNGMGYGPWGYNNGWGYPGYYGGMIPGNQIPTPATGVVGTVLGGVALLGLMAGGLGLLNRGPGNGNNGSPCATQRDLDYERQLTVANSENAQLKSQIYTDDKIDALRRELSTTTATQAVINAQTGGALAVLQQQAASFSGMQMSVLRPGVIKASEAVAASLPAPAAATTTTTASNG